jgi:Ca2+-dependent lipid-binding protein
LVHPNYLPLNIEELMQTEPTMNLTEPLGILRIIIFEAKHLKNADFGSLSDPFVVCKLGNKQICETKVVHNDLDPKFFQTFNIIITKGMIETGSEFFLEVNHKRFYDLNLVP